MVVWSLWGVNVLARLGGFIHPNDSHSMARLVDLPNNAQPKPSGKRSLPLVVATWALITDYIELVVRYRSITKMID